MRYRSLVSKGWKCRTAALPAVGKTLARGVLTCSLFVTFVVATACKQDVAAEASDSDANGYLCLKCGAKFYAARSNFLGPKCPKCEQEGLVEAVGYFCAKDNHLTVIGRTADRAGAVCEKCGAALSRMRLPREKDLQAWGANRVPK